MRNLLDRWLIHYDPIHRGWTPGGIANGVCATNGFAFPRVAGGYNLYRREVGEQVIEIVGAAGANADRIQNFSWAVADALDEVCFELRSIGGGGVESAATGVGVDVEFDSLAQPDALRPNVPQNLAVERRAGGRFEILWQYGERDQEVAPELFRVYTDNASGVIDYKNPIGEVAYIARQRHFTFLTGTHTHGLTLLFAVRAFALGGEHDGNESTAAQWADAIAPALPQVVIAEIVEVA